MRIDSADAFHPAGFPLGVIRFPQHGSHVLHSHAFSELVVVHAGSGRHLTGGESHPIKAGDVFVITGSRRHGYADMHGLGLTNLVYEPDLLALPTDGLREVPGYHVLFTLEPAYHTRHGFANRLSLSIDELAVVCGWVDDLEYELKSRAPGYRFVATALFMQIVGYLSRAYGRLAAAPAAELLRIAETLSHIETHYAQRMTLDDLAGIAHMSGRNLTRVFRAVTGHSPIDYLIRLRVARAAELLRREGVTVTAAALDTGFQDSNYFTRQFQRVYGISPSAFRQGKRLRKTA